MSYKWNFISIGGTTRVDISSGEDLRHLGELDRKLWTVLSCPTKGLEIDPKTLEMLDSDKDGKIRVDEVVATASYLTRVLKDADSILKGGDSLPLSAFNLEDPEGKALFDSAKNILSAIGKADAESIAISDTANIAAIEHAEWEKTKVQPYGEDSEAVFALVGRLKAKIDDYFLRCSLASYQNESLASLDTTASKIGSLAAEDLTKCMGEIAACPISHLSAKGVIEYEGINPAWAADFAALKSLALKKDFPEATALDPSMWKAVEQKIAPYGAWKSSEAAFHVAGLDISDLSRLLHYYRDFGKLLRNYVTLSDFYSSYKGETLAIFQCGKLFIEQRRLDLCIEVADMGKQVEVAGKSGMFIIYCSCVSKSTGKTKTIAAVLTDGDVDNIFVGQNAIFYDRAGLDYDAVVTKVIDNPVSVRQAFWSPYRKLANTISEKIAKSAADKEKKVSDDLNSKAASFDLKQAAAAPADGAAPAKNPFDIAKFAGIFAAVGMGVGFIGSFLAKLIEHWYTPLIVVLALVVVISGPSMILAFIKLRKRNLAPVLNANGWAINSRIIVNTTFGATLTQLAQYPKILFGNDPFAKKEMSKGKKALIIILCTLGALILLGLVLYFARCVWFIELLGRLL